LSLTPVPDGVADILLWRLAVDVAEAHQPQPTRPQRCTSLLCVDELALLDARAVA
jgi:hypothetical protein